MSGRPSVLVTGAAGYLGGVFLQELVAGRGGCLPSRVVAADVRETPSTGRLPGVRYAVCDVRSPGLADLLKEEGVDTVVHLASILDPGPRGDAAFGYSVDVLGTENVLNACASAGVRRIVVSSSGAAYGYHPDNPALLTEDHPLRGNDEFAYARHKRLVEEMLARWRRERPELEQVVLRVGTILGDDTRNQITALFDRRPMLALRGSETPFVFAWDRDVARCLVQAVFSAKTGTYNLAGDGALGLRELAALRGTRCVELPAWLVKAVLSVLKPLGLSRFGPEQVMFLAYRPVLDNRRLKDEFGFIPERTSRQVFEGFVRARAAQGAA